MAIKVLHRDRPDLRMPMIASDARLVVWPRRGAWTAPMNYVDMQPGEENVPHAHAGAEDAIFVLDGKGSIEDITNGVTLEFEAGQVVFVSPGVVHRVKGDRGVRIESVGGPAPADLAMLERSGVDISDLEPPLPR
jgi:quercetin dioxygenase-like cupin family protein